MWPIQDFCQYVVRRDWLHGMTKPLWKTWDCFISLTVFCSSVNGMRVVGLLKSVITVQSGALVGKWIATALLQVCFSVFEI